MYAPVIFLKAAAHYRNRLFLSLYVNFRLCTAYVEIKKLEKQRDDFEIPNEESITAYYKIRQQLKKLADDMLVCVLTSLTVIKMKSNDVM